MNVELVHFYCHGQPDTQKLRRHSDMMLYSDADLDGCHDFIQWLFPTPMSSQFNPQAPTLDGETIDNLIKNPEFHKNFSYSLQRIFKFLDFDFIHNSESKDNIIVASLNSGWWLRKNNHNNLRVSRILMSCKALGWDKTADSLYDTLFKLFFSNPRAISRETLYYWYCAVNGKNP